MNTRTTMISALLLCGSAMAEPATDLSLAVSASPGGSETPICLADPCLAFNWASLLEAVGYKLAMVWAPDTGRATFDGQSMQAEPVLEAHKVDSLSTDGDGDGVPSPGDTLRYDINISNTGDGAASGVTLRDLVPFHASLTAGSVATSQGTVVNEDPVEVSLGELPAETAATVTFEITIDNPVPAGVEEVVNQGTVTSVELPAVLTDDPDVGGDADPTTTTIVAAPVLLAEKTDALAADNDGDGEPSPGDILEYTITLRNQGNTSATGGVVRRCDSSPYHCRAGLGDNDSGDGGLRESGRGHSGGTRGRRESNDFLPG